MDRKDAERRTLLDLLLAGSTSGLCTLLIGNDALTRLPFQLS